MKTSSRSPAFPYADYMQPTNGVTPERLPVGLAWRLLLPSSLLSHWCERCTPHSWQSPCLTCVPAAHGLAKIGHHLCHIACNFARALRAWYNQHGPMQMPHAQMACHSMGGCMAHVSEYTVDFLLGAYKCAHGMASPSKLIGNMRQAYTETSESHHMLTSYGNEKSFEAINGGALSDAQCLCCIACRAPHISNITSHQNNFAALLFVWSLVPILLCEASNKAGQGMDSTKRSMQSS